MHGENKVVIKEDGNSDNYEISLLNARLSLQYFKLETNVRTTWYDLVNSENIRRVLSTAHTRYSPCPCPVICNFGSCTWLCFTILSICPMYIVIRWGIDGMPLIIRSDLFFCCTGIILYNKAPVFTTKQMRAHLQDYQVFC